MKKDDGFHARGVSKKSRKMSLNPNNMNVIYIYVFENMMYTLEVKHVSNIQKSCIQMCILHKIYIFIRLRVRFYFQVLYASEAL